MHPHTLATEIKPTPLIIVLLIVLAATAFILLWFLDLPALARALLGLLVLVYSLISAVHHLRGALDGECQALRVHQHQWFALMNNGKEESLEILRISNVIGLGYSLKVRLLRSGRVYFINLWRKNTDETFMRYLGQVKSFGLPNADSKQ